MVYAGGAVAIAAASAASTPAAVAFAATTIVVGTVYTAITLDSALNGRDWGLTGTIGGEPDDPFTYATHTIEFVCGLITGAFDPNDIVGPNGAGAANWVRRDATLPYKIRFENDPERANVPARNVVVTQPLDPALDLRSVRLQRFGFGGRTFEISGSRGQVQRRVDVRDSLGVFVDFNAGIDAQTGELFFSFRSIDPGTGQPPTDPTVGFLPPNDSTGTGEGFVEYTVEPVDTTSSGTEITAQADIVFDQNAAIETPEVFNTVDADLPMSRLSEEGSSRLESGSVQLSWQGSDPAPGSGARSYTLYAAPEDSSFQPVAMGLTDTTHVFEPDTTAADTYRFFTVAEDEAGNSERVREQGDVSIRVPIEDAPSAKTPGEFALRGNYPNPFHRVTTVPYDLKSAGSVEMNVYNLLGRRVTRIEKGQQSSGEYEQRLDLSRYASGVYFLELRVHDGSDLKFRKVQKLVLVR
jgi:hypothetical protein